MFSIDIELLTGRYAASRYNQRTQAEWPPHPARLFSACVATLYEHSDLQPEGRRALEWLETQAPPWIVAGDAGSRTVSNVYVPVNDTRVTGAWEADFEKVRAAQSAVDATSTDKASTDKERARAAKKLLKARMKLSKTVEKSIRDDGKRAKDPIKAATELLPERRNRQPRTFPSVVPDVPRVSFVWPDSEPEDAVRLSLAELISRLVRLGHSSSLVACRLGDGSAIDERPADTWRPDSHGAARLRVVTKGQLERLDTAFEQHRSVEPRLLPCSFETYHRGPVTQSTSHGIETVFEREWIVFRAVSGPGGVRAPRLRMTRGPDLARALRGALLKYAPDPAPLALTGHGLDGEPVSEPHVAYVPLPDVGSTWASGAFLGVAIVLPRRMETSERRAVLAAIGRWEDASDGPCRLVMGRAGDLTVERVLDVDPRTTLQSREWTDPATRWASVTPVALDRNPGDLRSADPNKAAAAEEEAERLVALACTRIGLPPPAWVQVMRRSLFDAAPKADAFMPYPRRSGAIRRVCVHVELEFDVAVAGPVLLGAGRYFGLGLCRPRKHS